ncbi:MAG: CRISPR-associated protein Cas4 [Candidatus Omnitrophica bacterium]|nr:CRISPR-associated protein Cas4 [Candidatus Omnitrophota bacterium]
MFSEEDFLPISALQHFIFCPRQCALIYLEKAWEENILTAEGGIMHDKAHEERVETRGGASIERGMFLRSDKLGLIGKADVVEFRREARRQLPFPIEYKHGRPKENNCDKVQLCAQALCLEEMFEVRIPTGALFYGKTRHRLDVEFTEVLRGETLLAIRKLREFLIAGATPLPHYTKKCESCSLITLCMPKVIGQGETVARYIQKAVSEQ